MAVYYASKAFVLSFTEAIANELAGTRVTVTALCPGPTQSEFQQRAHIENTRRVKNEVAWMKPFDFVQDRLRGIQDAGWGVSPDFIRATTAGSVFPAAEWCSVGSTFSIIWLESSQEASNKAGFSPKPQDT